MCMLAVVGIAMEVVGIAYVYATQAPNIKTALQWSS